MDVFDGPATQELGEERAEGVVYSVILKRVRYSSQAIDPAPLSHLRWVSQKVRTIQAGTLERLVEHLAPKAEGMEVSHAYRTCFLCTYRSFADTGRVVGLLVKRFLSLTPTPADSETERASKHFVQQTIISFLRLWLETYPGDFTALPSPDLPNAPPPSPSPHLTSLQPIIQQSHDLQKIIENLEERDSASSSSEDDSDLTSQPALQRPSQSFLFSLSPEEFAASLTAEDARLFVAVSPPQCLHYSRAPKDVVNTSTVQACIRHFNRVSLVVIATVLGGVAADARAFVIGQWINIAHHCRLVKNFSSLRAIVSGLQSTSVFRLRKSWERVTHSKLHLFEELSDLLSADYNHQSSRDLLYKEGTAKYAEGTLKKGKTRTGSGQSVIGVVPYLGTFLTDLTMLHGAHPDRTQEGLINFDKFRKQFQLLAELMLYQKAAVNYSFSENKHLLHWLQHKHTCSPADSYELSKQLEPDDLPNHNLGVSASPLAPISPSRIRRGLKQIFNVKGSSVGDYTLSHSSPTKISSSVSARDLTSSGNGFSKPGLGRSMSSSPCCRRRASDPSRVLFSTGENNREADEGELPEEVEGGKERREEQMTVVRVAFTKSDHCNYKSVKLGMGDKSYSIIRQSLSKLGIPGEAKEYDLYQVLGDKHQLIPQTANVYYALSREQRHPTLIIIPRTN